VPSGTTASKSSSSSTCFVEAGDAVGVATERSVGAGGGLRTEAVVYVSFPLVDSDTIRDILGVEDVAGGSTLGASTECTPRVHPYTNVVVDIQDHLGNLKGLLTPMAINSSKSKTGLLTVLQQDQDLSPSWNIYHLRWSGEEGAMHDTYRSARVVNTNFLCSTRVVELLSTTLVSTLRHYFIKRYVVGLSRVILRVR